MSIHFLVNLKTCFTPFLGFFSVIGSLVGHKVVSWQKQHTNSPITQRLDWRLVGGGDDSELLSFSFP